MIGSGAGRLAAAGCAGVTPTDTRAALCNRQLCFAHAVYLEAARFAIQSGVGSRGSALVVTPDGPDAAYENRETGERTSCTVSQ